MAMTHTSIKHSASIQGRFKHEKRIDFHRIQRQKKCRFIFFEMRSMNSNLSSNLPFYLSAAAVLMLLHGCTPRINQHGKVLEADVVRELKAHHHKKDDVLKLLGSPTSVDLFDENTWFYHSKKTETTSFFLPETLEERTLTVRFNSDNTIEELKLSQGSKKDIQIVQRETEVVEPEESILEQIFGSFSRFNEREDKP